MITFDCVKNEELGLYEGTLCATLPPIVELFFDDLFDDLRDRTTHLILEVRAIRLVAGDADLRKFDTQGAFVEPSSSFLTQSKVTIRSRLRYRWRW